MRQQILKSDDKIRRVTIRIPQRKAYRLQLEAARCDVSINHLLNSLIDRVIGKEKTT